MKSNAYIRARILAIDHYLTVTPASRDAKDKHSPRELLRSGFVHPDIQDEIETLIEFHLTKNNDNDPLEFHDLTSYSNWFVLHPEKLCGEEKVTTSFHFPIKVVGSKQGVIDAIRKTTQPQAYNDAKAMALKLKLLEIELDLLSL